MTRTSKFQDITRIVMGIMLVIAGIGHLSFARVAFAAQVPPWVPLNPDLVVILSGVVEIILGLALIFLANKKHIVGWTVAIFFVAVFPGNIAQLVHHRNAFGLNSELTRWARLPLQPLLILAVLWATGQLHSKQKNI